jgi:putative N6-adenine-specific DNA methylase
VSSSSDKPPRQTLRLKATDTDPERPAREENQARKRRPVRWSPLARDRAAPTGAAPAGAAPSSTTKAAGEPNGAPAKSARKKPDKARAEYPRDRPGRKPASDPPSPPRGAASARKPGTGPRKTVLAFFAPCPRGLEEALAQELTELGASDCQGGSGGVAFRGDMSLAWKANLWSRLAIRILLQVDDGVYRDEADLYNAALRLPWSTWFSHERSIAVRTVAHASPLKSLNFASLKIKDAVCDRFRQDDSPRPNVEAREPDVPILLFLHRDHYTLYLDLSGTPLNRRGFRVDPAPAPLNENLAAGLLKLAGWTPDTALLDPMMGGGTLLLEAALIALNIAPGGRRHFAFENLASFDRVEWTRLRKNAEAAALEKHPLPIYGCDIDPRMVEATHNNLRAAGLDACVQIDQGDVLAINPPEATGILVSNPPYGVRLEQDDAATFYAGLGDALKQRFSGWSTFLLSADPDLPKRIGLKSQRRTPLYNGPLECRLYEYRVVRGSLRRQSG